MLVFSFQFFMLRQILNGVTHVDNSCKKVAKGRAFVCIKGCLPQRHVSYGIVQGQFGYVKKLLLLYYKNGKSEIFLMFVVGTRCKRLFEGCGILSVTSLDILDCLLFGLIQMILLLIILCIVIFPGKVALSQVSPM